MKLVLSPAKSLDFNSQLPTDRFTEAYFLNEAETLNGLLKKKIGQKSFQIDAHFGCVGPSQLRT